MISLGIEGTAHTLGIGIVDDDTVLADIKRTYIPETGGIHPRDSSRHIADNLGDAVEEALEEAEISRNEVDLVSFSKGPGLGPCLSNTAVGARALALSLDIPIVGVNHCVAHIEMGNMMARKEFPDWAQPLTLYVSGANTQIIMFREGRYRVFGETLDIGTGNMLDKFGRKTGLGHPAGPKIEKLAKSSDNYIELPYVIKGNDLSLSGLLTESIKKSRQHPIEDVCY
jgi:glycoprotease/Kae1 family metallohydrolase